LNVFYQEVLVLVHMKSIFSYMGAS